jgi:hypothetical protein
LLAFDQRGLKRREPRLLLFQKRSPARTTSLAEP